MSAIALGVGVVVGSAAAATAFSVLSDDSEEGCNGHHWGEPYELWANGRLKDSRSKYIKCSMFGGTVNDPRIGLDEEKEKKCQDCGETKRVTETVATMRVSDFEETVNEQSK